MAQWSTRINKVIFAVLDVSWTMGLNSDKTTKVFCINICHSQLTSDLETDGLTDSSAESIHRQRFQASRITRRISDRSAN